MKLRQVDWLIYNLSYEMRAQEQGRAAPLQKEELHGSHQLTTTWTKVSLLKDLLLQSVLSLPNRQIHSIRSFTRKEKIWMKGEEISFRKVKTMN